jgi:hypothetical protein
MFVQKSGFHQKTVKHGNVNIKNSNFPPKRMDLTIKNGEDWRFKPQNVGIYPLVNVYTTNWKITIFNGKTMGKPWENGDLYWKDPPFYSWVNPLFPLGHVNKFAFCKRLPSGNLVTWGYFFHPMGRFFPPTGITWITAMAVMSVFPSRSFVIFPSLKQRDFSYIMLHFQCISHLQT